MALANETRHSHGKQVPGRVKTGPSSCADYLHAATPECWSEVYGYADVKPVASPGKVDIGIVGYADDSFNTTDLRQFLAHVKPDAVDYEVELHLAPGYTFNPDNNNPESALDVQNAVAIAPTLKTVFFGVKAEDDGCFAGTLRYFASLPDDLRPGALSISFLTSESDCSEADALATCKAAQMLAAMGTTTVFGSGDWGVTGTQTDSCEPGGKSGFGATFPSTCLHILNVAASDGSGGPTFFPEKLVDGSSRSTLASPYWSGSGVSRYIPRPEWQTAAGAQVYLDSLKKKNDPVLKYFDPAGRSQPDITAFGANTYLVYKGTEYAAAGGTSLAVPITASMIAMINAQRRAQGKDNVGWVHPVIYSEKAKMTGAFVDIFHGASFGCQNRPMLGFRAVPGFDFASGLGRPSFPQLSALFL